MRKYCGIDDFLSEQPVTRGRALVVGSKCYGEKPDRRKLYENAVGLDLFEGEGVDIVHDLETPLDGELFDHVDCCSVLEHVKRPWLLCENIEAAMRPGATILIMVPFVWRVHNYPGDYWRMSMQALDVLFPNIEWTERGYMMGDRFRKVIQSIETNGHKYLQRSETVAFGHLVSK